MYDQVAQNKRRSLLLVAGFVVLVVVVVLAFDYALGYGVPGVIFAFALAGFGAFGAWWKSDAIALAMSRAHPADPRDHPRLHNIVEGLCIGAGLPKPRLYLIDDPAPNAFATGRNPRRAAIAVTTGLLEKMNRIELEGVLAHELSHVKNYDTLVSTLAVTLVGVLAILSDFGIRMLWWNGGRRHYADRDRTSGGPAAILAVFGFVLLIVAPILGKIMQLAVSRRRESLADVSAIEITRYPPGLISALEKLRDDHTVVHSQSRATAHLWIEHPMALDEDEGRLSWFNRLFNTHPPLEDRIAALREL